MERFSGRCQQLKKEGQQHGEAKFMKNVSTTRGSRPPLYNWKPTVPYWEKEFTLEVGLYEWKEFVELKKRIEFFKCDKVMNWNDSAGEDAFKAAKTRFHQEHYNNNNTSNSTDTENIHRMSTVPLPDPDMYIDVIDWNSSQPDATDLTEAADKSNNPPVDSHPLFNAGKLINKPTGIPEERTSHQFLTGPIARDHVGKHKVDHRNISQAGLLKFR